MSDLAGPMSTALTAVAGLTATLLATRYSHRMSLAAAKAERTEARQAQALDHRRKLYARVLREFEEYFDSLVHIGDVDETDAGLSHENIRRNTRSDLRVQMLERDLELVAPVEVLTACRHVFLVLRRATHGVRSADLTMKAGEEYRSRLAMATALMRLDLAGDRRPAEDTAIVQEELLRVYALNAPPSAFGSD